MYVHPNDPYPWKILVFVTNKLYTINIIKSNISIYNITLIKQPHLVVVMSLPLKKKPFLALKSDLHFSSGSEWGLEGQGSEFHRNSD